jgi:hypothetical protein
VRDIERKLGMFRGVYRIAEKECGGGLQLEVLPSFLFDLMAFRMSEWLVRVEVQKLELPTLI